MSFRIRSSIASIILAAATFSGAASATALTENFDNGLPAGWTIKNLSDPVGRTSWFAGIPAAFSAHEGAAASYVAANFNSGGLLADLSTWLILPTSVYNDGDTLSFWTRTEAASVNPDSLELRFSSVGGSDVGNSSTSVGTFSNLLLSINPGLAVGGYPEGWSQYSVSLSGLGGATNGAFAFRYVVAGGGPLGSNSNYIGIDTMQITAVAPPSADVPEPAMFATMGLGLGMLAFARRRRQSR